MKKIEKKSDFKCVQLKGELSDWGKHILLPFGFTLCGMATVDADKEKFPQLNHPAMKDMVHEYSTEKWEITCEKCLEMFEIVKGYRKNIN